MTEENKKDWVKRNVYFRGEAFRKVQNIVKNEGISFSKALHKIIMK